MTELENLSQIAKSRNVSGEIFDLSVPTFNNEFGQESIIYAIKYGTAYPIQKYIDELEAILAGDSGTDDKAEKRKKRLNFLYYCENNIYIRCLFQDFVKYLNGGNYTSQYHIITIAGGNIFVLFAQLLLNMIDTLVCTADALGSDAKLSELNWDIVYGNNTENYNVHQESVEGEKFLDSYFDDWKGDLGRKYWWSLNNGFNYLSATNKYILDECENYFGNVSKQQIWFYVANYIMNKRWDIISESAYDLTLEIALSPHSDFDYKLTPNIHPEIDRYAYHEIISEKKNYYNGDEELHHDDEDDEDDDDDEDYDEEYEEYEDDTAEKLIIELVNAAEKSDDTAGFLLIRAKSLIIAEDRVLYMTTKEISAAKRDCANNSPLGNTAYGLYPQIMQREFFNDIDKNSLCYKYLTLLQQKKDLIAQATRNNISEINKYFLSGVYAPADGRNKIYQIVGRQENSTESMISYLNRTTNRLNSFINAWEHNRFTRVPAPGLHIIGDARVNLHGSSGIDYATICSNFITLNNIMNSSQYLIPRLCCDIIFNFVNYPEYYTEKVLDALLKTVNNSRRGQTPAYMPESAITVAPNQPRIFNDSLAVVRDIFQNISNRDETDMTALPNGLRIVINSVVTESITKEQVSYNTNYDYDYDKPTYNEDNIEDTIEHIARLQLDAINDEYKEVPHSHYISFNYKVRSGAGKYKRKYLSKEKLYSYKKKSKSHKSKGKKKHITKKKHKIKKHKVTKCKKNKKTRKI